MQNDTMVKLYLLEEIFDGWMDWRKMIALMAILTLTMKTDVKEMAVVEEKVQKKVK